MSFSQLGLFLELLLELIGLEGGTSIGAEILYHLLIRTENSHQLVLLQGLRSVFEVHFPNCYK